MNDKAQVLLAAFLKLYSHMSRIGFYCLRYCIIKNGVDDTGSIACEGKMMLLGETINTRAQNAIFSDDFGNIKAYSPPLHAVLCRTRNDTGFRSIRFQVLADLSKELRDVIRDSWSIQLFGSREQTYFAMPVG
jgi:hypothetical protein